MARPVHTPAEIAAFQDGETRQVYARDRQAPAGPLFYLEDNAVDTAMRAFTREPLECFIDDCPQRELVAVHRESKRDGFRHRAGAGGHEPESLFHDQAKHMIADWIEHLHADAGVCCERGTSDRRRRADVMVTWPSGRQLAIEVQYSKLSVQEWRERTDSYRSHGIAVVWLFGHCGHHMKPDKKSGAIKLNELHQTMRREGHDLLWVNPIHRKLGTVGVRRGPDDFSPLRGRTITWNDGYDNTSYLAPPSPHATLGQLLIDPLLDCTVATDSSIRSPALARLHDNQHTLQLVNARRRALDQERGERERRTRDELSDPDRQLERWHADPGRDRILTLYGGDLPAVIAERGPYDHGVLATPAHWHTVLYLTLVHGWPVATRFTVGNCYQALRKAGIPLSEDSTLRAKAITRFLGELHSRGSIRLIRQGRSIAYAEVKSDLALRSSLPEDPPTTPLPIPAAAAAAPVPSSPPAEPAGFPAAVTSSAHGPVAAPPQVPRRNGLAARILRRFRRR